MSFLKEVLLQWIVGVPGPSKGGKEGRGSAKTKSTVYIKARMIHSGKNTMLILLMLLNRNVTVLGNITRQWFENNS